MGVLHNIITFSKDSSDAYQNKMTQVRGKEGVSCVPLICWAQRWDANA